MIKALRPVVIGLSSGIIFALAVKRLPTWAATAVTLIALIFITLKMLWLLQEMRASRKRFEQHMLDVQALYVGMMRNRRDCPFYGRSLDTLGVAPLALIRTYGNQCGLVTTAHSPCRLEIDGRRVEWSACEVLDAITWPRSDVKDLQKPPGPGGNSGLSGH